MIVVHHLPSFTKIQALGRIYKMGGGEETKPEVSAANTIRFEGQIILNN